MRILYPDLLKSTRTASQGLKTSYQKTLPLDKELKGNAEIVTQDLRLIEHFFTRLESFSNTSQRRIGAEYQPATKHLRKHLSPYS
ncbi:hypothetical protein [Pedobacter sp. N23S346]|uniref:hypothetical protein n=1 Tax=Pedobacter sp. N23S346 TaxID=3402750 RepID=UPI003AD6CC3A